jgi:hypothetical protein
MGFTNIFKGNSGGAIVLPIPKDDRPAPALSLLVLDDRAGSRSDRLSTKGFTHCGAFVAWDRILEWQARKKMLESGELVGG